MAVYWKHQKAIKQAQDTHLLSALLRHSVTVINLKKKKDYVWF